MVAKQDSKVKNFGEFGESPQCTKFFSPIFPMKHVVPVVVCHERTTREVRCLNIV